MTRTVLCFGDSNTHGAPGDDPEYVRLAPGVRWPGQLRTRLGEGWTVIEEGLNGRTVASDYPDRPGLNGRTYLGPCLLSHNPLDVVVLMLGSNDVKTQFALSVEQLAEQWEGFLDDLFAHGFTADWAPPRVILVSPAPLDPDRPRFAEQLDSFDAGSVDRSRQLATAYREIAKRRGLVFFDAAQAVTVGDDGLHLTARGHAALAEALAPVILSGANTGAPARP